MTLYPVLIGILLCLILSAFCSGAEMAYSSCNTMRLESAKEGGSKRAAAAVKITEHFDDALSAILIGNNLANIASSSLASVAVILIAGSDEYTWVATVIMTLLVIVFGETIPKITCKKCANRVSIKYSYVVRFFMIIFRPLIWLVVGIINLITRHLKGGSDDDADGAVEELSSIIDTAEDESVLDEDQSELVHAAIDFSDISAFEIMTARVDVQAIDIEDDWEDILALVEDEPFTRLPVYQDSIDNIIGTLYLNQFFKALTESDRVDIRKLLMPPCYVYKTTKLPMVLSEMKKAKQHLAIVTDEFGGTLGVVTMEDVLEQIVGEIWDESDTVEEEVIMRGESEYELDGSMVMDDFLDLVGLNESDVDAESSTVGGWTLEMFGDYPAEGDSFDFENLTVEVLSMDGRRVEKVLVKVNPPEED
ncbi:MAG: hemolysin family protein [Candidatus Limivicinus sp.]|jgi:putative hemolysin